MIQHESTRCSDNGTTAAVVLNLPPRSLLYLDGQTMVLQRDDFVGIVGIPTDGFHFLSIRPCIKQEKQQYASITTGFVLPANKNYDNFLLRQYDATTEEVSHQILDELTRTNLQAQLQQPQALDPQRFIPYASVVRSQAAALQWSEATSLITWDLLSARGIAPGTKIVPGSQQDEEGMNDLSNANLHGDGNSPRYPMIPVLDEQERKRTRHRGTKLFLQSLSPTQRTALLFDKDPPTRVFDMVLQNVYRNNWRDLLGDIQLSYTLFLNLHCYASLEHWRDTVALCCRVSNVTKYSALYTSLVQILSTQIQTMEIDFWNDAEMSGDNFLVPSLQKLVQMLAAANDELRYLAREFGKRLRDRLPQHFNDDVHVSQSPETKKDRMALDDDDDDDDPLCEYNDDDEDGPVVVAAEEVQAAWQRTETVVVAGVPQTYPPQLRQQFPILFAAQQPHEDIVMTCARALDAATDVSLVREAAEYLEQVEAQRRE